MLQLVLLIRKLIWAKEKEREPTMVSYKSNETTFRYNMMTYTQTDNTTYCTYWETQILLSEWREKDHEKAIAQTHGLKQACVTEVLFTHAK